MRSVIKGKGIVNVCMNLAGLEFGDGKTGTEGTNYTKNSVSDYQYCRRKNYKIVRVPFTWERLQPTLNGALNTTYLGYINENITWAQENGLQVLLDIHNYGKYNDNPIKSAEVPQSAYLDFLDKIAQEWAGNETVWGIDIMNEPNGMVVATNTSNYQTSDWTTIAQAGINQLRSSGFTQAIVICGDNWSGVDGFESNYGVNPTPWWTGDNIYYSFHHYFDDNNAGVYDNGEDKVPTTSADYHIAKMKHLLEWAKRNNIKLVIGEVGIPIGSVWHQYLEKWLTLCDQYKDVYIFYWAIGSWYTAVTGASPNNHKLDKPQITILDRFT